MIRDKVTMTELEILLEMNKKPQGVAELAETLQASEKAVPVYVKRMIDKGIVQNTESGLYKRARYAITGAGREIVKELQSRL